MRAFLVALALLFVPMLGRAAEEQPEPCPAGWEPGSPLYSQVLIVPPLVALPELEPMPQGWPPKESVGELAEHAIRMFAEKNFRDSIERLEVAYAIDPQPLFLFNMAQAFRLSDDPRQAIVYYQRFQQLAPTHRFKLFFLTDGEIDHDDGFWAVLLGLQNVRNVTNYGGHH
ncbi:MAG TPA: hypothetical protein PK472_11995 [Pseudomonadota bacterium]|nr:hypothetical protein [Pseudomonadota bacterium]